MGNPIYTSSLATPGNLTTNATPNTETDAFFLKAGTRSAALERVDFGGKGAGLTALSGLVLRCIDLATASTAGTSITPMPADPAFQACKATAASRPTIGTTRKQHFIVTCGATSPNFWLPQNVDAKPELEGASAHSTDLVDASGTASLAYEASFQHSE